MRLTPPDHLDPAARLYNSASKQGTFATTALCFLECLDGFRPRQARSRIKKQRQCRTTVQAKTGPRGPCFRLSPSDHPWAISGPSFDEDDVEGSAVEASIKVFAEARRQFHVNLGMAADKSSKHIRQSGKDKVSDVPKRSRPRSGTPRRNSSMRLYSSKTPRACSRTASPSGVMRSTWVL